MRRLAGALVVVLLACVGCTGSSEPEARPTAAASSKPAISLASLEVDWPRASDSLDVPALPKAPAGFSTATLTRMAGILTTWAQRTTLDEKVWRSDDPAADVASALPSGVGATLRQQVKEAVSPHLAVANVFPEEVTVVGRPLVTTAWKVSTETDDQGEPYVLLELQTRAAYEVRLGDDAPTRVIGMLRVHGLSAYADTTDDFGVTGGWQEFGAADCALALDDSLVPDSDLDETVRDLKTFVKVGDGDSVEMPTLGVEEQVDSEYLKRCRNGQV